ncbi:MAG: sulfur carrier protein ThiS [Bacillota bacterium]
MMKLNGTAVQLDACTTLKEFLIDRGYDISRIAVEKNGNIVPKTTFSEVMLEDEDVIEVVRFVGGG